MLLFSNLYYLSFFIVLVLNYLIMNNFLGSKVKSYYIKVTKMSIISLTLSLFVIFLFLILLLNYLDLSLYSYKQDIYFNTSLDNYISENTGDNIADKEDVASSSKVHPIRFK